MPLYNPASGGATSVTTKGDLQGYSTLAARIPVGTDTHVMTADSAQALGLKWAAPSAGTSALVFLETHTASASSSLDFTSFISATYDTYVIEIVQLRPATDTASIYVEMGTGGGPTYDTGNNYEWAADGRTSGGAAVTFDGATGLCPVFPTMSNNSGYGFGVASLTLYDPQSTTQRRTIAGSIYYVTSTGPAARQAHWGMQYTTLGTALTALRFIASSGNITSGTIRIYGVAKS